MIKSVSIQFTNYLGKHLTLSDNDKSKIQYTFQLLLGDFSKLIIMLVLFAAAGYPSEFLFAAFALMLMRPVTGGLHFKTYAGCLLFSIVFFAAVIACSKAFVLTVLSDTTALILCTLIVAVLAPLPGASRPKYSAQQNMVFKAKGCALVLAHLALFLSIKNNPYCNIAVWVIFIQTIQLIIKKGGLYYEIQSSSKNVG